MFPTKGGSEKTSEVSLGIRRIQSTVEYIANNSNNNQKEDCCLNQKCLSADQITPTKVKINSSFLLSKVVDFYSNQYLESQFKF